MGLETDFSTSRTVSTGPRMPIDLATCSRKNDAVGGHILRMTHVSPTDLERRERFVEIFHLSFETLQAYVLRRGGGSDTDDIVAEVLMVLWRRLETVPTGFELPWALGVARRCLSNHRRSVTRRDQLVERLTNNQTPPPSGNAALDEALDRLDADELEMVRLWAWEGLAPREIALVMDLSANAVSIRLHRARRRLGELLDARKNTDVTGHISDKTTKEQQ